LNKQTKKKRQCTAERANSKNANRVQQDYQQSPFKIFDMKHNFKNTLIAAAYWLIMILMAVGIGYMITQTRL
jgi:type VI protein secretion system component VasF